MQDHLLATHEGLQGRRSKKKKSQDTSESPFHEPGHAHSTSPGNTGFRPLYCTREYRTYQHARRNRRITLQDNIGVVRAFLGGFWCPSMYRSQNLSLIRRAEEYLYQAKESLYFNSRLTSIHHYQYTCSFQLMGGVFSPNTTPRTSKVQIPHIHSPTIHQSTANQRTVTKSPGHYFCTAQRSRQDAQQFWTLLDTRIR